MAGDCDPRALYRQVRQLPSGWPTGRDVAALRNLACAECGRGAAALDIIADRVEKMVTDITTHGGGSV